jgi:putative hydrolase of the HAD superfamily
MSQQGTRRPGLLLDYGGVLTSSVSASLTRFCVEEGLPADRVMQMFHTHPMVRSIRFAVDVGMLAEREVQRLLAGRFGGDAEKFIRRFLDRARPDTVMLEAVRAARRQGVRTGLISNSWGRGGYDRSLLPELFCGVVISGEVGIRKPSKQIYLLGAEALELPPSRCVFVDDQLHNLAPARELGMATVHHRNAAITIPELERLIGVPLS